MTSADWPTLRALRLQALADAPTAFYATLAKEAAMTEAEWQARARDWSAGPTCQTFLAFGSDGTPCGLAAGIRDRANPATAVLISMWVHASARRLGVGRALVERVVSWARKTGYANFEFEVTETNERAKAFYESLGFRFTGINTKNPNYPELTMLGMAMPLRTRQMRSDEWELYRDLRTASIREAPTAFGMTLAEAEGLSEEEWRSRTIKRCDPANFTTILGLDRDGNAVGMASGSLDDLETHDTHPTRAKLLSMWVAPAHRRTGLAKLIVQEVLKWAREKRCDEITLSVTEGNTAAIHLYERLGFRRTGTREQSRSHPTLETLNMTLELT